MALDLQQTDTNAPFGSVAACSGLAAGSTVNAKLCEVGGTAGSTEFVATHAGSAGGIRRLIHFELDVPADTDWDAGDWTINLNITTLSSQLIWQELYICRVDSGGTNQETIASATGLGIKLNAQFISHTLAGIAQTPSVGDRVYVVLGMDNGQTMSNTVGTTPSELISSPFTAAGGTVNELTGSISGSGSMSGDLGLRRVLSGSVAGVGSMSGALTAIRTLSGSVAGTGTLSGTLEIVGSFDPADLAVNINGTTAELSWTASGTPGVADYQVFRRTPQTGAAFDPAVDTPVATGITGTTHDDVGLDPGDYDWQVFGRIPA